MTLLLSPLNCSNESGAGAHKNPISSCEHAGALEMPSRVLQGREHGHSACSTQSAKIHPKS